MKGVRRPSARVLTDAALIPSENLIEEPPALFTHVVQTRQPYFYVEPRPEQPPDGHFERGTRLALLARSGGAYCRVVCSQGLSVFTEYASLEPLEPRAQ